MTQTLYMLDGKSLKSIPLHALPESAFQFLVGGPTDSEGDLSPVAAFNAVPWLYRGIDIRAKAVSSMPFGLFKGRSKVDRAEETAYEGILRGMKERLYRTEAALCLNGAGYWITDTNRWGLNVTPRWVVPTTMKPKFSDKGLTGFKRKLKQYDEFDIPLERVVYFWMPSLEVELGPGTAPAQVALRAAGVLHNLDTYVEGYFERGAVRTTLLLVDGQPSVPERNKIKAAWQRLMGVKQSYEAEIFSKQVEPKTIGDNPSDTAATELTRQKREDVSTALGVPQTLLFSDAATNATAFADRLNLYDETIIPQCELIEEAINEQLLKPLGLRLEFQPKRLEVYQQAEVQKAAGISMLLPGKAILSLNEARALLELDPVPGGDWEDEEARRQEQLDLQRQKLQQPQMVDATGKPIEQGNTQGNSGAPENGAQDDVTAQQKAMIDAVILAATELKAMREALNGKHLNHNQMSHGRGGGGASTEAAKELVQNAPKVSRRGDGIAVPFSVNEDPPYPKFNIHNVPKSTETVSLSDLVATQKDVERSKVMAFLDNPDLARNDKTASLPVVVRHKGTDYIHDGHHRLAALEWSGVSKTQASVIEI